MSDAVATKLGRTAYQRWELASLAGSAPGAGREQAARDAELASCRAEAVAEGRAAGYAAGLAQATAARARLTARDPIWLVPATTTMPSGCRAMA